MRTLLLSTLIAGIATLAGCASSQADPSAASGAAISGAPTRVDAILVQQAERRFSLKLDADGNVLDQKIDEEIAVGGRVATVNYTSTKTTSSCDPKWLPPGMDTPPGGAIVTSGINIVDGASSWPMVLEQTVDGTADMEHTFREEIRGYVGPYVFLHEEEDIFGCGAAHPSWSVTGTVYDLRTHQPVTFAPPAKVQTPENGKLAELVPHFDANGHLTIEWRFEVPSDHATADHVGSDYTKSISVQGDVPAELAAYADAPASIAKYLAAHPEQGTANPILGWSQQE